MSWLARIRQSLAPPAFDDEEKTRVGRLLHTVLLAFLVFTLFTTLLLAVRIGPAPEFMDLFTMAAGVVMVIVCVALLALLHRGFLRLPALVISLVIGVFMTYWVIEIGGIRDGSILAYPLIVTLVGLLLGSRAALVSTVLCILVLVAAYVAETSGLVTIDSGELNLGHLVVPATALALTGLLLRYAVGSMTDALASARRNERAQREANRELQAMRESLEQRVAERTRDLEQRSIQLQAASEVSRVVLATLEPESMLRQAVDALRRGFDLFHAAVFTLDETKTWLEYRAGSGEAGRLMREHGLRLELAGPSQVSKSVTSGRMMVVPDVSEAVRSGAPPYLPGARSEAVLPLIAHGQVIGALELQSDRDGFFDEGTLTILRTVADQVAAGLDNARLFAESQAALETVRRAYGEVSRQAWAQALQAQRLLLYRCDERGVARVESAETQPAAEPETPGEVVLPLKVREHVLGGMRLRKPEGAGEWTAEEIALVEMLSEQLGVALESARLYSDAQRRATREQVLSQLSDRLSRSLNLETLLQVAVRELGQWPDVADAAIHLGPPAVTPSGDGEPKP